MLIITYKPGLSKIRHECTVEISSTGYLRQRLRLRSCGIDTQLPENESLYEVQLTEADLHSLILTLTKIDFPRLASRLQRGLDTTILAIEAQIQDKPLMRVEGPILSYERGYHDFKTTFEPAQALWKLISSFMPQNLT